MDKRCGVYSYGTNRKVPGGFLDLCLIVWRFIRDGRARIMLVDFGG